MHWFEEQDLFQEITLFLFLNIAYFLKLERTTMGEGLKLISRNYFFQLKPFYPFHIEML